MQSPNSFSDVQSSEIEDFLSRYLDTCRNNHGENYIKYVSFAITNMLHTHQFPLSEALSEKLQLFIDDCFFELYNDAIELQSLNCVRTIYPRLHKIIKTDLFNTQASRIISKIVQSLSERNFDETNKYVEILNLLLENSVTNGNELTTSIVFDFLKSYLPKMLMCNHKLLMLSSLTIFYSSCQLSDSLTNHILLELINNAKRNDVFFGLYFPIISCIYSQFLQSKEIVKAMKIDDFLLLIKLGTTNHEKGTRKCALSLLKTCILECAKHKDSNIVWDCRYAEKFSSWWKTFFVITESLEEKQTHLVLPVFPLMCNLIHYPVTERPEIYWVLNLVFYAMKHDSEAVRIEAFFTLFRLNSNELQEHKHLIFSMLCSLNDSTCIRKMHATNKLIAFKNNFIDWVSKFASIEDNFNNLINDVINTKWSPIPLYYFLEFLLECNLTNSRIELDEKSLFSFMNLISHLHNVIIRYAIQNLFLQLLLKYSFPFITHVQVVKVLSYFNVDECLYRGSVTWIEICKLIVDDHTKSNYVIKDIVLKKKEMDTLSADVDSSFLVRQILWNFDALSQYLPNSNINHVHDISSLLLENFTSYNPYSSFEKMNNSLRLIILIMKNERTSCTSNKFWTKIFLEDLSVGPKLADFTISRLLKCPNDYELLDFYEMCIRILFQMNAVPNDGFLENYLDTIFTMMKNNKPIEIYCSFKIIYAILKYMEIRDSIRKSINYNLLEYYQRNKLKIFKEMNSPKATSNHFICVWNVLRHLAQYNFKNFEECFEIETLKIMFENTFEFARPENWSSVFKTFRVLCKHKSYLELNGNFEDVLNKSWNKLEEISNTPNYMKTSKHWIKAFIQAHIFEIEEYRIKVVQYLYKIVKKCDKDGGQSFKQMKLILEQLEKIDSLTHYHEIGILFIEVFCVPRIVRKDLKIEFEIINHFRASRFSELPLHIWDLDFSQIIEEVRLRSLNLIFEFNSSDLDNLKISINFLTRTKDSTKKRYFANSLFHRQKQKNLQLILFIESILNEKCPEGEEYLFNQIYDYILYTLLAEPHQASIKYLLEWILARLLLHQPDKLIEPYLQAFSKEAGERINCICSFISVALLVSKVIDEDDFIDAVIKLILPWTMGQHFTARLSAQIVLLKLININQKTRTKYEILEKGLSCCLKNGNVAKNTSKLENDFYFSNFHPTHHFTIETILFDLPRLSQISQDEWIPVSLCKEFLQKITIPFVVDEYSLSTFDESLWLKSPTIDSHIEPDVSNWESLETQKKFIPSDKSTINDLIPNTLIIVASLIDKANNLGGLTRTCEIFGVSKLVVNNLDIINNKEFKSLSITAEKHLNIIEVKRFNLFNYLKSLKEDGYALIGLEQSTNSKLLSSFKFHSKCVVLLGNEKEGIPASLLPVLDTCVEIPQMGVIRSLNVHVSASLMIWEFVKQQIK